jgi:hypothetical protein
MRLVNSETTLYEQLARWLSLKHPELIGLWHFDLAGINNPSKYTRALYGRLNERAWPDFGLMVPRQVIYGTYHGLFLELKRDGTRLRKRDGRWASPHIAEQATVLARLQAHGYTAQFACGLDEATQLIDSYLEPA